MREIIKKIINKILYYILIIKAKITYEINKIIKKIIDVKKIKVSNKKKNKWILVKYYIIKIINKGIEVLKKIREKVDEEIEKIEITKYTENNKMIIDKELHEKEKLKIKDVIKYIKKDKNEGEIKKYIIMKFDIHKKDEKINIKKYIEKYRDKEKSYHNTLENIIIFNNIKIEEEEEEEVIVEINYMMKGKREKKKYKYKEIKKKHINEIK